MSRQPTIYGPTPWGAPAQTPLDALMGWGRTQAPATPESIEHRARLDAIQKGLRAWYDQILARGVGGALDGENWASMDEIRVSLGKTDLLDPVRRLWRYAELWLAALAADPPKGPLTTPSGAAYQPRISCAGRGCFGCCRGTVSVAPDEAAYLVPLLPREALAKLVAHRPADPRTAWCPLLKDGACSIYEVRPLSCRIYHSVLPAANCHDPTGKGEVAQALNALALAIMEVTAEFGVPFQDAMRQALGLDDG